MNTIDIEDLAVFPEANRVHASVWLKGDELGMDCHVTTLPLEITDEAFDEAAWIDLVLEQMLTLNWYVPR